MFGLLSSRGPAIRNSELISSELWSTYRPRSPLSRLGFFCHVLLRRSTLLHVQSALCFLTSHTSITLTTPVTSYCYLLVSLHRSAARYFWVRGEPGENGSCLEDWQSRGIAETNILLSLWTSERLTENMKPYFAGKLKGGWLELVQIVLHSWTDSNWARTLAAKAHRHTQTHLQMDFGWLNSYCHWWKDPAHPKTSPLALKQTSKNPLDPFSLTQSLITPPSSSNVKLNSTQTLPSSHLSTPIIFLSFDFSFTIKPEEPADVAIDFTACVFKSVLLILFFNLVCFIAFTKSCALEKWGILEPGEGRTVYGQGSWWILCCLCLKINLKFVLLYMSAHKCSNESFVIMFL